MKKGNKMKKRTFTISLLLAACILAPLAMAEDAPAPRGPRHGQGRNFQDRPGEFGGHPGMGPMEQGGFAKHLLGRIGDKLELTEAQRESIQAIVDSNEENAKESRKAIRQAMQALHEAAAEGTEAEIIAAGKTLGDAFTELALQRSNSMKQVKEVLTDAQIEKWGELKAQMKERMQQRSEKGQDRPGGKRGPGRRRPPQEQE
jgi:Spy/CpxP family protein refolding chaperone